MAIDPFFATHGAMQHDASNIILNGVEGNGAGGRSTSPNTRSKFSNGAVRNASNSRGQPKPSGRCAAQRFAAQHQRDHRYPSAPPGALPAIPTIDEVRSQRTTKPAGVGHAPQPEPLRSCRGDHMAARPLGADGLCQAPRHSPCKSPRTASSKPHNPSEAYSKREHGGERSRYGVRGASQDAPCADPRDPVASHCQATPEAASAARQRASASPRTGEPPRAVASLSVRDLRGLLDAQGVEYGDCLEKADLVDRLRQVSDPSTGERRRGTVEPAAHATGGPEVAGPAAARAVGERTVVSALHHIFAVMGMEATTHQEQEPRTTSLVWSIAGEGADSPKRGSDRRAAAADSPSPRGTEDAESVRVLSVSSNEACDEAAPDDDAPCQSPAAPSGHGGAEVERRLDDEELHTWVFRDITEDACGDRRVTRSETITVHRKVFRVDADHLDPEHREADAPDEGPHPPQVPGIFARAPRAERDEGVSLADSSPPQSPGSDSHARTADPEGPEALWECGGAEAPATEVYAQGWFDGHVEGRVEGFLDGRIDAHFAGVIHTEGNPQLRHCEGQLDGLLQGDISARVVGHIDGYFQGFLLGDMWADDGAETPGSSAHAHAHRALGDHPPRGSRTRRGPHQSLGDDKQWQKRGSDWVWLLPDGDGSDAPVARRKRKGKRGQRPLHERTWNADTSCHGTFSEYVAEAQARPSAAPGRRCATHPPSGGTAPKRAAGPTRRRAPAAKGLGRDAAEDLQGTYDAYDAGPLR